MPTATDTAGRQSSSLYLYTFVATLVLLLAISGIIVSRSMVLRRRQRALVLEAIANGTYVPPLPHVRPADRPKMWEVYLSQQQGCDAEKGWRWADLKPVSALAIQSAGSKPAALQPQPGPQAPGFLRRPFLLFHRAQLAPTQTPPPAQAPGEDQQPQLPLPVQVAVLVAMPGSGSSAARDELPVLEIGVGVVRGRVEETVPEKAV
ncbi:hypothetical protein FA95DRAFT_1562217 [Auriscalpium vulgare]|uniref:Uncharacterized protein n=1 Tax=Auriscalpium vulgare TaxID=40419 RepID=A0ACB8RLT2_9AGAM|nr:hypothetical protein FA95DRAFT_1562217 [Auriscalpium vulgare]